MKSLKSLGVARLRAMVAIVLCLTGAGIRPSIAQEQSAPTVTKPATQLPPRSLSLMAGRGELVQFEDETSRVSVSDPAVADAVVISEHDVVINGKTPGVTTILVWHGANVSTYHVTVNADIEEIQAQLKASFPNQPIAVTSSKDALLLSGSEIGRAHV